MLGDKTSASLELGPKLDFFVFLWKFSGNIKLFLLFSGNFFAENLKIREDPTIWIRPIKPKK